MKVLLTHRYFWPDSAPYAIILRTLGNSLADAGHEVHTFSSVVSYRAGSERRPRREKLDKLEVRRVWVFRGENNSSIKRLVNALIYSISLFVEVLRQRPDVVTASTFPPVVAGWSASLAAKLCGARFIYHVQDIHPEVSIYSGGKLGLALPARVLTVIDNQTLRRADTIITLSKDMAETLRARGLGDLPVTIINNPPLQSIGDTIAAPIELIKAPSTIRIIFAGNIGRFQNLDLMVDGVSKCFDAHPNLELMFLGDGASLPELKRKWSSHPQVRFAPFLPYAQAKEIIGAADIGVVSLNTNLYKVAYPSKLGTYLDLGLKVLALIEHQSQLALELEKSGQGAVPENIDAESIRLAVERLIKSKAKPKMTEGYMESYVSEEWRRRMIEAIDQGARNG